MKSEELTLERMTDKDVDEFLALEKRVSVPKIYNPIQTADEALEEIRDNELFFIQKGSVVVGTIAYQKKPDGSAYISNMSVVPEYQKQGIARMSMEMILGIMGVAPRIWLVTHPENIKALNLYTSLGFVVEKQVENYYGDGEPRLVLAKHVDFNKILEHLKEPVAPLASGGAKAIDIGIANKSYVLTTEDDKKYVARVLRTQMDESARAEALIQHALFDAGIHSPMYLPFKDGDVVAHIDDQRITISPFIEGQTPKKQSLKLTRNLGVMLARIHNALAHLPPETVTDNRGQALRATNIADEIARIPAGTLATMFAERFEKLKTLPTRDLPRTIIHGDLFGNNVFEEEDEITAVFDFETAEYTIRILDLGRPHLENLEKKTLLPHESIAALFEGYDSVAQIPLSEEEKAAFDDVMKYFAIANAAWLANNLSEESARRTLNAVDF